MPKAISINEANFEQEVLNHKGTVLVDFYTASCSPCQLMTPVIDKLAKDVSDTVKVVKVDAADNYALVEKYLVNSVPAFILIEDGKTKKSRTGIMPPAQLKQWLGI